MNINNNDPQMHFTPADRQLLNSQKVTIKGDASNQQGIIKLGNKTYKVTVKIHSDRPQDFREIKSLKEQDWVNIAEKVSVMIFKKHEEMGESETYSKLAIDRKGFHLFKQEKVFRQLGHHQGSSTQNDYTDLVNYLAIQRFNPKDEEDSSVPGSKKQPTLPDFPVAPKGIPEDKNKISPSKPNEDEVKRSKPKSKPESEVIPDLPDSPQRLPGDRNLVFPRVPDHDFMRLVLERGHADKLKLEQTQFINAMKKAEVKMVPIHIITGNNELNLPSVPDSELNKPILAKAQLEVANPSIRLDGKITGPMTAAALAVRSSTQMMGGPTNNITLTGAEMFAILQMKTIEDLVGYFFKNKGHSSSTVETFYEKASRVRNKTRPRNATKSHKQNSKKAKRKETAQTVSKKHTAETVSTREEKIFDIVSELLKSGQLAPSATFVDPLTNDQLHSFEEASTLINNIREDLSSEQPVTYHFTREGLQNLFRALHIYNVGKKQWADRLRQTIEMPATPETPIVRELGSFRWQPYSMAKIIELMNKWQSQKTASLKAKETRQTDVDAFREGLDPEMKRFVDDVLSQNKGQTVNQLFNQFRTMQNIDLKNAQFKNSLNNPIKPFVQPKGNAYTVKSMPTPASRKTMGGSSVFKLGKLLLKKK